METHVPIDAFDQLDEDKLERVLILVKEHGLAYFECGSVKLGFTPVEAEKSTTGFIPLAERIGTQAAAEDGDNDPTPPQYRKVFAGRVPSFGHKPKD